MANTKEDTNELVSGIENPGYNLSNDLPIHEGQHYNHPMRQHQAGAALSETQLYAEQPYAVEPSAGYSYTRQPYAVEPSAGYSYTRQPYAGQFYTAQPYGNAVQQSQSSNSTVVVTQQPRNVVYPSHVIPDNMCLSFFACLCCFWPLGIVAIYKSSESQNALARGDFDGAARNSREARTLSFISIGVGVVLMIIGIVLAVTLPMRRSYYYGDNSSY